MDGGKGVGPLKGLKNPRFKSLQISQLRVPLVMHCNTKPRRGESPICSSKRRPLSFDRAHNTNEDRRHLRENLNRRLSESIPLYLL